MRGYLRLLGVVLLAGGLTTCVVFAGMAIGDERFVKAGEALERHPEHILFQSEYYQALVRHVALIAVATVAGFVGIVGSAMLFGLHAVLRRLERLENAGTVSQPVR